MSLIDQSFQDWTCEVHNDDPDDQFVAGYIKSLNDDRFIFKNHISNLGPTRSFNLAFSECAEKYASILEDDNWWEADFLSEMIKILEKNNHLDVAWSNMYIWQETKSGNWENTLTTVWPDDEKNILFHWPNFIHAMGALHSNGAMLFRTKDCEKYAVPNNCDFNMMEAVRERTFRFPIYLHKKPLANFASTLHTSRANDNVVWTASQTMLLASIILSGGNYQNSFVVLLNEFRSKTPSPLIVFFLANAFFIRKRALYTFFKAKDWFYISKWLLKNFYKLFHLKKQFNHQNNIFEFMLENTRERYLEAITIPETNIS